MKIGNFFLNHILAVGALVLSTSAFAQETVPTWSFQLEGDPIVLKGKHYQIVDLNYCSDFDMGRLKVIGSNSIGYISSHYEEWRPDKDQFPAHAKGKAIYEGENWVNTADPGIRAVMTKRIQLAKSRGFAGIVFDNVDFTGKDTGFDSSKQTVLDYLRFLMNTTQAAGMKFGLKNGSDYLAEVAEQVDLFVVQDGIEKKTLEKYQAITKPILNYETKVITEGAEKYPNAYSIIKEGGSMTEKETILSTNGAPLLKVYENPSEVVSWSLQYEGKIVPRNKAYHVVDMFEVSDSDLAKLRAQGTKTIAYFSSQYEDWRPDKWRFPKADIGLSLDNWEGERWIRPTSQPIRAVMIDRMKLAKKRGFHGIDVDNVDFYRFETGFDNSQAASLDYIRFFITEAKKLGLKFSLKNATELAYQLRNEVDFYQNEEGIEYNELHKYLGVGKPVFNIEYKRPKKQAFFPGIYSIYKSDYEMDAREEIIYPTLK